MKLRLPIFLLGLFFFSMSSYSQNEIHFTQFDMAPVQLNPALAGAFEGTYRIGGIYRDQWFSVISNGNSFKTLDMFVDANVIRGLRKQDWLSVSLGYDALDQGGSTGLKNNYSRIGASYHLALDKKRGSIITLGVQRLSKSSTINMLTSDQDRADVDTDINAFNMGMQNMEGAFEGDYSDWVFGLTFNKRGKTSDLMIGIKANQLFKPRWRIAGLTETIDPLIAGFASLALEIDKGLTLTPSVLYQTTGPASELILQTRLGKQLNEKLAINGGLGFRTGDAIQILLGGDYKQFNFGASYDVNISALSAASGTVGAFELALNYTGIIRKKPKVKPIILCPRL